MKNSNLFQIKRIGGYLHKITEVTDETGKIIDRIISPIMVELKPRDVSQIMAGAIVLAIPVCLTEECWVLAENLSNLRALMIVISSIVVLGAYVYFNFYRNMLKGHVLEYIKRVVTIYIISGLVVIGFLTIIDKFPVSQLPLVAWKRVAIALLPCSMGASIVDGLK